MTSGGLLPRTGSSSCIASLNGHSTLTQQQWQQASCVMSVTTPNGRKHVKTSGLPLSESRERRTFRCQRILTGRRVGMLVAVVISLFSLLMLLNAASHASIHFRSAKDKEEALGLISEGRLRSSTLEARNANGSSFSVHSSSESLGLSEDFVPVVHLPSSLHHSRIPWPLVSSDQPLPYGHPCEGFKLPPPPADKKRTGPRPCPVCYLPITEAIKKMPRVVLSPVLKKLSYFVEVPNSNSKYALGGSEFGGHFSIAERNKYFMVQEHMNIHCGFVKGSQPGAGTGFDIDEKDRSDMDRCTGIVVASAIFGNYDLLQQPTNINLQSRKSVCFFMFVDEETQNSLIKTSTDGQTDTHAIWKVVVVRNLPYPDARRNGKIPKLLLHRLFPNARFSLWIDGKLKLIVDPYQILERFLWRKNQTFAISQHYKRLDVFEEAEANKAAGKYDNASIDAQIHFYQKGGLRHYNASKSSFRSDVPEGCVIIREHTPITNLLTCLWFNEVDRFTSRDQLSFSIVRDKLMMEAPLRLNMFLDCERRNFVVQAYHRELLELKNAKIDTFSSTTTTTTTNRTLDKAQSGANDGVSPLRNVATTLQQQHARRGRHLPKRGSGRHRRGGAIV